MIRVVKLGKATSHLRKRAFLGASEGSLNRCSAQMRHAGTRTRVHFTGETLCIWACATRVDRCSVAGFSSAYLRLGLYLGLGLGLG